MTWRNVITWGVVGVVMAGALLLSEDSGVWVRMTVILIAINVSAAWLMGRKE